MLDAFETVLITLGSILLIAIVIIVLLALLHCQKKEKRRKEEEKKKETWSYYVDQPVTIVEEGRKENRITRSDNGPSVHYNQSELNDKISERREKKSIEKWEHEGTSTTTTQNTVVVIKDEGPIKEINTQTSTIRRLHRPTHIDINPSKARAEMATAVNTEHHVDHFIDNGKKRKSGINNVIQDEYQILEKYDNQQLRGCFIAQLPENRMKNRFSDILPSDDTRVILRGKDDYINASLIDGFNNSGQFIATQGPIGPEEISDGRKENTVADFWRMIWEKNVHCIVMLTNCVENMRPKCSQYWGEIGVEEDENGVHVTLVSESIDPICIHREFDVYIDTGIIRKVSQYHFTEWRDSHAPDQLPHLLDLIQRLMIKGYRKPIVVHCSAGVGRTGVFIALWNLLERARQEHLIDIFGAVADLRQQRSRMVQSADQYICLYEAMAIAIRENRI